MPPGDIIPEVIRSIVKYMNITNAAILFDESFGILQGKFRASLWSYTSQIFLLLRKRA